MINKEIYRQYVVLMYVLFLNAEIHVTYFVDVK